MIGIIDYGAGNISSVQKAVNALGHEAVLTADHERLLQADKLILPGVGAFGTAMEKLHSQKLDHVIREACQRGIPLFGICLGLQILFEESEESPGVRGLSLLKGSVRRLPGGEGLKIPHMGWNSLRLKNSGTLFEGLKNPYVYFVHSYYLEADEEQIVKAEADYGITFHASVEKGRIYACQFHPEKSSSTGMYILKRFLES